jgi:hypothetical protein
MGNAFVPHGVRPPPPPNKKDQLVPTQHPKEPNEDGGDEIDVSKVDEKSSGQEDRVLWDGEPQPGKKKDAEEQEVNKRLGITGEKDQKILQSATPLIAGKFYYTSGNTKNFC